jgi:hypothetical protein
MRRLVWLGFAVLLFAVAALLMTLADRRPDDGRRGRVVEFPRHPRPPEFERMQRRRTLAPAPGDEPRFSGDDRRRDPVLVALPAGPGRTAVVAEASALAHSPVGQLLLACLHAEPGGDPLDELRRRTGIDLVRDVDRVGVFDDGMLVSGHFQEARWGEVFKEAAATRYGAQATIYTPPGGEERGEAFATWGGTMLLVGKPAALRAAIDRLEGRAAAGPAVLAEHQAYGDIYGVVGADLLGRVFGGAQPGLARQFREAADRIELHVEASGDVALVATVRGNGPTQVADLGKTLGAALALARVDALARGERDLAELLDHARVTPAGPSFTVELALPQAFLEKHLAQCGRARPPARPASEPSSAPAAAAAPIDPAPAAVPTSGPGIE